MVSPLKRTLRRCSASAVKDDGWYQLLSRHQKDPGEKNQRVDLSLPRDIALI